MFPFIYATSYKILMRCQSIFLKIYLNFKTDLYNYSDAEK